MKRILIVKTSSLGDVIHCLPVINDIHAHYPDAQIDWVVEESFADIPRMHPRVNQVVTVAMRRWKKAIFKPQNWLSIWAEIALFKKNIKQYQYDALIDCQGLLKSALVTKHACTTIEGLKHGYDQNSIREPIASQFYEKKYAISYQQHAITRNRALCAMSLEYAPPSSAPDYGISARKSDISFQNQYVIALHGTSRDSKLWPTEHWVELGKQLAQQKLQMLLPWASDSEKARAELIANALSNAKVLPKLSIAQMASGIADATAAVGVDTGLSHLAAALNVPTIAIYTDTNPELTGVMAGNVAPAINLGGITQTPTVSEVLNALNSII